ncbi:MAG: S-layer homology domain-containing protein, partial [Oscillospiraceae bacterium]|nr:S-layer homology domain-containing protein [Oscillospiraceae bacterium]
AYGLPGKDPAVKKVPVTAAGTTFPDIAGHPNKAAIEALAARGIINGYNASQFGPNDKITRAQFAKITIMALGMSAQKTSAYSDVASDAWYAGWVGTATAYKIVNGYGGGKFGPDDYITREQAATMVARAAKLCGMNPDAYSGGWRDYLASFGDYMSVSDFARGPLAFCYDQGILDKSALNINPKEEIKRCEIAQMVYNMLSKAKLL